MNLSSSGGTSDVGIKKGDVDARSVPGKGVSVVVLDLVVNDDNDDDSCDNSVLTVLDVAGNDGDDKDARRKGVDSVVIVETLVFVSGVTCASNPGEVVSAFSDTMVSCSVVDTNVRKAREVFVPKPDCVIFDVSVPVPVANSDSCLVDEGVFSVVLGTSVLSISVGKLVSGSFVVSDTVSVVEGPYSDSSFADFSVAAYDVVV